MNQASQPTQTLAQAVAPVLLDICKELHPDWFGLPKAQSEATPQQTQSALTPTEKRMRYASGE